MFNKEIMRWIVPLLAFLATAALPLPALAQTNPSDIRTRLAQSYEKSGDFESALRVYNELFASDSGNFSLIESLKRCHLKLKQHDEVIALIEHGLRLHPRDLGALAQLGNVWFLKGDEAKALDAWQRAVAIEPNDETTYRVVGSSMVQVRQFEQAVETYRTARTNLAKYPATHERLDVAAVLRLIEVWLGWLESDAFEVNPLRQRPPGLSTALTCEGIRSDALEVV